MRRGYVGEPHQPEGVRGPGRVAEQVDDNNGYVLISLEKSHSMVANLMTSIPPPPSRNLLIGQSDHPIPVV